MSIHQILTFTLIMLLSSACKSESQKQKEEIIETSIQDIRSEIDRIEVEQKNNPKTIVQEEKKSLTSHKKTVQKKKSQSTLSDKIIGVWEVKNDYYMAVYEIQKHQGKYVGLLHYYNDGKDEITGDGSEKFYFLSDVLFQDGLYKNGKMYMPDGSHYQVVFKFKNNDELEAKMTVQGQPYSEIWKRKMTK